MAPPAGGKMAATAATSRRRAPAPPKKLAWLRNTYDMTDAEVAAMFQVSERTAAQWRRGQVPQKYYRQIDFAYQYHYAAWAAHGE